MSNNIPPSQLLPGDVFLLHGNGFISDMIRLFDGSQYSHAAFFDGSNVVEAIESGVTATPLAQCQSVAEAEYVHVYRFISQDGHQLGDPGYGVQPLLDTAAQYVAAGERYAYEQILLLAVLAATRRMPVVSDIPFLRWLIRNVTDNAADIIAKVVAAGKEPMICSELVYRCYTESGPQYDLLIRGADTMAARMQALPPMGSSPEAEAIRSDLDAFLAKYHRAKLRARVATQPTTRKKPRKGKTAGAHAAGALAPMAVADFVTPRDLRDSPDLTLAGALQV